ncbi:MAG: hypothetical protein AB8G22_26110 [Saprospiraceae bacterium]
MEIPQPRQAVEDRVNLILRDTSRGIKGKIVDHHIVLDIVEEDVHYWSPQLNFRIEPDEMNENHTVMSGLIGPRPEVWTLFMFIYFGIGVVGFFVSSYGIAKWQLGEYSNFVLALPIALLLMLSAYAVGKYGERLASDQMEQMKQVIRDAIVFD